MKPTNCVYFCRDFRLWKLVFIFHIYVHILRQCLSELITEIIAQTSDIAKLDIAFENSSEQTFHTDCKT